MSDSRIVRAVRFAVETAEVTRLDPAVSDRPFHYTFTVEARSGLQKVIKSPGDLALAAAACDQELKRQISVCRSADGATAALDLKDNLHTVCGLGRLFVTNADGVMQPIDTDE